MHIHVIMIEIEARLSREAWKRSMDASDLACGEVMSLRTTVLGQMSRLRELHAADRKRHDVTSEMLKAYHRRSTEMGEKWHQTTTSTTPITTTPSPQHATTTTSVTYAQLQAMIDQGVIAALAARDANRNGDDSHTSGTGGRRTERVVRECTYQDFMKCKPLYFNSLREFLMNSMIQRMDTVFRISNCSMENQIKFSTCTLLAGALTWWNSHVMTVSHAVAYAMTWADLRKKMTDKYCPRNEMKKLEAELWNLKVKGTDVIGYNQRFRGTSTTMCIGLLPEESDKI
ncbi:reverse transcriptase domain-containing protein [Tanacetum coccineum]